MSNHLTTHTEQPTADSGLEQQDPLIVFFGIGVVINVVLITAYFIWAYKQWNRTDKPED